MPEQKTSPFTQIVSEMINALVCLTNEKDAFYNGHSDRVANLCLLLARKLKLNTKDLREVYLAGKLHDVGIVYVPQDVVQKFGELTNSENEQMQQHPLLSEKVLSQISIFHDLLPIVRHHHEHYDGTGYPQRLKGELIPLGARILCLVDSYDRMVTAGPNKSAMPIEEALDQIINDNGHVFDPNIVPLFVDIIKETTNNDENQEQDENEGGVKAAVKRIVSLFERGDLSLPVLPTIVERIREVLSEPNASADQLANVLDMDAVISVRMITVANSVVFRGRDKVLTVRQAVPRLGTKETNNIVLAIVNRNMYQVEEEALSGLMEKLWEHSLATAICSRLIAKYSALGEMENYYTMGLIHDIGKVPLLQAIVHLRAKNDPAVSSLDHDSIKAVLQDAHTKLGAALLKNWEFDPRFIKVAQMHESAVVSTHTDRAIVVVTLANILTRTIGLSLFEEEDMDLSDIPAARQLVLSEEKLNRIRKETKEQVAALKDVM